MNARFVFGLALALTVANTTAEQSAPPPAPWALPGFHGDGLDIKPPVGAVEPPAGDKLDARALFDLVLTCYPTRSWWRPELALQGRASNQRRTQQADATGQIVNDSGSYAALILTVPLYSAAEVDKERERERARRGDVAGAVGKLEKLLADRGILRRELSLWRAVETRSAKRVTAGVAETQEQINAIRSVAETEGKLRANRAYLTAQTLELIGLCADRSDVEAAINRAIGEAKP